MSFSSILYTIILYPLIQIIEISYLLFDKLFSNTGIAILGVSLTVTLLCLPLYVVAERETQKRLRPGIDRIKATFKGDEQYMILSTFYRQNHYHPIMALRSSFGLLIQIPFFMAAYSCLSSLPALQGQSFLFIKDMAKPDALFSIGSFDVNILPIAMTVINIIAGAIYTKGFAFKDKAQIYGMALLFLVILYTSPSGLVLYWTMNNVFSLVKNIFYKLKNPIKVLYYLMCIGIVAVDIYILFVYDGGASLTKRLYAVIPLSCLIAVPVVIKGINYLLDNHLTNIINNKKDRFLLFFFSAIAITVLSGLVLPSQLISSSVQEFSNIENYGNPNTFLLYSFFQSVGLFIFWPICIYFLFGKRIQTLISCIFSSGVILSIINAFVFTGNYGSMDVTLKFIDGFSNPSMIYMLLNLIVLLVITVGIFVLFKFRNKIASNISLILSVAFVVLSFVNIGNINKEYNSFNKNKDSTVINDLSAQFSLSKTEKNVVVFMLDRAKSNYFESILDDQPYIKESFEGFTYYPNTISANSHTLIGSPGLYGGYEYLPSEMNKRKDVKLKDKHNESLLLMPRIFTEQADFNATVSDLSWGNYSYVSDLSFMSEYPKIDYKHLHGKYSGKFSKEVIGDKITTSLGNCITRNLFFVSMFREVPCILRPVIYYKGSWLSSEITDDLNSIIEYLSELYYLQARTDFNSEKSSFICLSNEATHANINISSLDVISTETLSYPESAAYDINTVCLKYLADWFNYLRQNDVWDNTKIIIVSDHAMGYGANSDKGYDNTKYANGRHKDELHPILLVKDFNSKGPVQIDMTFMSNADVPTLTFKDIVNNPVNPFTGKIVTNEAKKDGVYITSSDIFMPHHNNNDYYFNIKDDEWFNVKDNIFIDSNWTQEVPQ